MPDHIHLFVRLGTGSPLTLGNWIKGLKRHLGLAISTAGQEPVRVVNQKLATFWQPGFHDHLLRHSKSYAEKWNYVRENPVRGRLVTAADDWPYAGEIVLIDRA